MDLYCISFCGMWLQSFGTDRKSLKAKVFIFLHPRPGKSENNFMVPDTTMLNGLQMGYMWSLQYAHRILL